jgi:hypothetical protein
MADLADTEEKVPEIMAYDGKYGYVGFEFHTKPDQYIDIEVHDDGRIEIEVNESYYKDRDNYTVADDATIYFTREQASEFLTMLEVLLEKVRERHDG